MPHRASLKTKDGRFGYEAAGDPASPPLVFLHGIGGAARAWRDSTGFFWRSLSRHCLGHAGLWWFGAAPSRQHCFARRCVAGFPAADRRNKAHPCRAFDRRHDRSAIAGEEPTTSRSAVVLAQTSPAFGKPDGDWQKTFIGARLGPLDRGETMVSLAPSLVKELVGDNPDAGGMDACPRLHGRRSRGHLSRHDAGSDGVRPAQRARKYRGADAGAVGLQRQNAPAPMMAKMATYIPSARYVELEGTGHLANLERPATFNAALDQFLNAHVAATRVTAR